MNNNPLPVDNTGAHDEIPAPGGAGNTVTGKTPFYLSKYFWTNLAALLALIIPDVRAWLDSNPIEFFSALGAVNILLQFISGGKYQLAGEDGQSGQSANPAGVLPLPVASMGEDVAPPVEDRSQYPDQDTSSMPNGSGSSSPLSGTTRLMIVLGALMILLGNSCSKDADPVATSVALTDGQVVVIRGGSSLVVDRTEHKLLWSQAAPEVVVAPVVQAATK